MNFLQALDAAELTNVGLVRERNEDTSKILIPPPDISQENLGALFVVVDGMGGLGGGDVASKFAAAELARHYYTEPTTETDAQTRLHKALQAASDFVSEQAPKLGLERIGATAAGIILSPTGDILVFNVGDCRVYRIRDEQIKRLSHDQSVMEREIEAGMSPEQAAHMTKASAVTAFLGQPVPLNPVVLQEHAQIGDTYIICSDGLWSLVNNDEIAENVKGHPADKAAQALIKLALKRGGQDNVTAVVVRIVQHPNRGVGGLLRLLGGVLVVILLVVGVVGFRTLASGSTAGPASVNAPTAAATTAPVLAPATKLTTASASTPAEPTIAPTAVSTAAPSQPSQTPPSVTF